MLPLLNAEAMEARKRAARVRKILEAFQLAPRGMTFIGWLMLSEEAYQRRLAEAVEPLLKQAEEGQLWQ